MEIHSSSRLISSGIWLILVTDNHQFYSACFPANFVVWPPSVVVIQKKNLTKFGYKPDI